MLAPSPHRLTLELVLERGALLEAAQGLPCPTSEVDAAVLLAAAADGCHGRKGEACVLHLGEQLVQRIDVLQQHPAERRMRTAQAAGQCTSNMGAGCNDRNHAQGGARTTNAHQEGRLRDGRGLGFHVHAVHEAVRLAELLLVVDGEAVHDVEVLIDGRRLQPLRRAVQPEEEPLGRCRPPRARTRFDDTARRWRANGIDVARARSYEPAAILDAKRLGT